MPPASVHRPMHNCGHPDDKTTGRQTDRQAYRQTGRQADRRNLAKQTMNRSSENVGKKGETPRHSTANSKIKTARSVQVISMMLPDGKKHHRHRKTEPSWIRSAETAARKTGQSKLEHVDYTPASNDRSPPRHPHLVSHVVVLDYGRAGQNTGPLVVLVAPSSRCRLPRLAPAVAAAAAVFRRKAQ